MVGSSPVNVRRDAVHIPGLGTLASPRLCDPPTVRWFVLDPAGIFVVRDSGNWAAHHADAGIDVQWQLARDVKAVVDPDLLLGEQLMRFGDHIHDDEHHVLWFAAAVTGTAHAADLPINPVASLIWRQIRPDRPVDVFGTVAGIGYADDTHIHRPVEHAQLVKLHMRAAQLGAEILASAS